MDYDKASDFEINKAVAEKLGYESVHWKAGSSVLLKGVLVTIKNYCNRPKDAWPIILENEISIRAWRTDNEWFAHHETPDFISTESGRMKNPLRAAMVVFLKMQDKPE